MTQFPFSLIGFDLDGTLLDTSGDLGVALNHALTQGGFASVPMDQVRTLVGGGTKQMLAKALALDGVVLDADAMTRLTQVLVSHYEANIAVHSRLFPGGEAMLDALDARGVKMAVVTNKMEHLAVRLLDEIGLSHRFVTIIGGDTLGPGRAKPKPDLLQLMLERAGVAASRAAYVGDTTFDTGAAAAAGLPCVAVRFGFCDKPADDLGADRVIDHFDDLVDTLADMGQIAA
ncbi:HAD-IA family hydrolase [Novosphingobium sp. FSY-8]|uniref:phosphoglycolate phosphatase n=1 Tax=Novosphingobium ovatum TaxID=1908523 RepID=A0ABW9XAQ8_9SPHN|nr:HAD-IA family hydrolase [Novosphingobium ovatum]NBC35618.1 HAD-IA family hydrolase [Novosphingobium ovatum]